MHYSLNTQWKVYWPWWPVSTFQSPILNAAWRDVLKDDPNGSELFVGTYGYNGSMLWSSSFLSEGLPDL